MKKALLVLAMFIGFNLYTVQAQDEREVQETDATVQIDEDEVEVEAETEAVPAEQEKQRTKAGKVLHETGSAVGSAAKWTGKEIGQAASWTWGKLKHNKLTKEVFDQPGDEDKREIEVQVQEEE